MNGNRPLLRDAPGPFAAAFLLMWPMVVDKLRRDVWSPRRIHVLLRSVLVGSRYPVLYGVRRIRPVRIPAHVPPSQVHPARIEGSSGRTTATGGFLLQSLSPSRPVILEQKCNRNRLGFIF